MGPGDTKQHSEHEFKKAPHKESNKQTSSCNLLLVAIAPANCFLACLGLLEILLDNQNGVPARNSSIPPVDQRTVFD